MSFYFMFLDGWEVHEIIWITDRDEQCCDTSHDIRKKNKKEQDHDKDAFLHELLAVLHFYLQWIPLTIIQSYFRKFNPLGGVDLNE